MSHIVAIKTEIKDVEAAKAACKELGWTFNEGATTFQAWGSSRPPCCHSITVNSPLHKWQIGLVKTETGYRMEYDHFLELEMQKGKTPPLTKGGSNFLQLYATHKATMEARKRGYTVARSLKNGSIQLVVTGMR